MRGIGPILLAIWLIAYGLTELADLRFRYDDLLLGALAVVAGIFLLIRR